MEEYYGWIFVEEKLPPLNEDVLIVYVEEDDVEERDVEYMVTHRFNRKIIYSEIEEWKLPPYYRQSCVRAWRKLPPFTLLN